MKKDSSRADSTVMKTGPRGAQVRRAGVRRGVWKGWQGWQGKGTRTVHQRCPKPEPPLLSSAFQAAGLGVTFTQPSPTSSPLGVSVPKGLSWQNPCR